jgi:hypothetical protein
MSKRFIITEEEKKDIQKLYNLNEQSGDDKANDDKAVDALASIFFPSTTSSAKTETNHSDDSYLNDKSSGSVDSKWIKVTKKVIDKFEGGYWNPKCGHQTAGMGKSTETMFGLDRYNGNIESTPEGKKFFKLIDDEKNDLGMEKFCRRWHWNYKGGELEDKLKTLAAIIMKQQYDKNAQTFFTPELKKRVESNDRLLMHFSYASWNGPGFFKKFAKSLGDGVKDGKSDSELVRQAVADRKNTSLLNQDKVASVITSTDLNLA